MFVVKARSLTESVAPERCFTWVVLGLTSNNRLGWKGLTGTNTLAYHRHLKITDKKVLQYLAQK
jgi:hypothetical protein